MRVAAIYPTWARGEVSPLLYGRVDLEAYNSCLKKCRNAWVRPYGGVSRIPGTEHMATAIGKARLLKFVFSAVDSYIIECGAGYFRFYNDGGYVVNDNGDVYEISNPFTEEQLHTIQYVQLDDIIKIVYKDDKTNKNKPLELIRKASNNWELREVDFKCTPFLDENLTDVTLMASADTGDDVEVTASSAIFNSKHVGSFWTLGGKTTVDNLEKQGFFKITSVVDSTHVKVKILHKLSTTTVTTEWAEGAWSDYRGYPSAIGLMDGRIYYGRTPSNPRNIYGSQPYKYEDFTPALNNEASGAINIEMATNTSGDGSDIRWIVGTQYLLVGTYGAEFVVKGSGDMGITPTDVSARARSNWGVEAIQPAVVDSMIHFVQRTGKKVRQFTYDYYLDAYKAIDISIFSEHLLESPIVEMVFQKNPDSILWCVRKDGKVAGLTLETNQQVQAWCLLEFDGSVESMETIPSYNGLYDEVYFVIKRTVNGKTVRHVERMQNLITPEEQPKCWYVRDGLYYNAFEITEGTTLTLSGKTGTVTATTSTNKFTSLSTGRRIRVVDNLLNVEGELKITEYVNEKTVKGIVKKPFVKTTYNGTSWGISIQNVSGIDHLEGKEVQLLTDGAVQTSKTVTNGSFKLDVDAFYIIAGLKYQSYFTTMPAEVGAQNGTSVGKKKRINEMSIRLWRTSGARVGKDLDSLEKIKYREPSVEMGMPQPLFTGVVSNVKYNQGWTTEATITMEQSEPLPMNVLAIAPFVNENDK